MAKKKSKTDIFIQNRGIMNAQANLKRNALPQSTVALQTVETIYQWDSSEN